MIGPGLVSPFTDCWFVGPGTGPGLSRSTTYSLILFFINILLKKFQFFLNNALFVYFFQINFGFMLELNCDYF